MTGSQRGFSLTELLIVVGILAIFAALAMPQLDASRRQMRLASAEREFAAYAEKARSDSVRRHAVNTAEMAGISINPATPDRYLVTMSFGAGSALQTRPVFLPRGVTHTATTPQQIRFDWRGRLTANFDLGITDGTDTVFPAVKIVRSGDVMTGPNAAHAPSSPNVVVNATSVTGSTNINQSAVITP